VSAGACCKTSSIWQTFDADSARDRLEMKQTESLLTTLSKMYRIAWKTKPDALLHEKWINIYIPH
jgi:hypothetical protein